MISLEKEIEKFNIGNISKGAADGSQKKGLCRQADRPPAALLGERSFSGRGGIKVSSAYTSWWSTCAPNSKRRPRITYSTFDEETKA
jgi:hypothetical protein